MRAFAAVILSLLSLAAMAGEWSTSGFVAVEAKLFPDASAYPGQLEGAQTSLEAQPELSYRSADGQSLFQLTPYLRVDSRDAERNQLDLVELSFSYLLDGWELVAGVGQVFWGVTESRHLVDVINQTDAADDIDEESKLGQPMITISTQRDWGLLSLYGLPGFRERTFPGEEGRLRAPLVVNPDAAQYESGDRDRHVDWAVRYSHYLGDWDMGAHVFRGTGREPALVPDGAGTELYPFYQQITQVGVDVQYTRAAWLWKLEALVREGQGDTFAAAVAGLEYTRYQIASSDGDLGLLVEYLYDGRDETAPVTAFDNDIFIGARWARNDTQDTTVLGGAIIDVDDGSTLLSIEAERRLGDRWKLTGELRWLVKVDPPNALSALRQDSHVALSLARYF